MNHLTVALLIIAIAATQAFHIKATHERLYVQASLVQLDATAATTSSSSNFNTLEFFPQGGVNDAKTESFFLEGQIEGDYTCPAGQSARLDGISVAIDFAINGVLIPYGQTITEDNGTFNYEIVVDESYKNSEIVVQFYRSDLNAIMLIFSPSDGIANSKGNKIIQFGQLELKGTAGTGNCEQTGDVAGKSSSASSASSAAAASDKSSAAAPAKSSAAPVPAKSSAAAPAPSKSAAAPAKSSAAAPAPAKKIEKI